VLEEHSAAIKPGHRVEKSMNTNRQAPFPVAAIDLRSASNVLARFVARLVRESGRASRAFKSTVLHLNKGATTWITKPLGRRITCETGALWLCFDGELEDIVLEPG